MFRVLRFSPQATLTQVAHALRRTPARRLALVFPLGIHSALADVARMTALAEHCVQIGKDVTIVGGDELLRASAAASGLRAAMTLDDWRAALAAAEPERRKPFAAPTSGRRTPNRPQLALVLPPNPEPHPTASDSDDWDAEASSVDPPAYVRDLLALHGRQVDARARAESRPLASYAGRTSSLAYAEDDDSPLRMRDERHEELLTATIRRTSGLDSTLLSRRWRPMSRPVLAGEAAEGERDPD